MVLSRAQDEGSAAQETASHCELLRSSQCLHGLLAVAMTLSSSEQLSFFSEYGMIYDRSSYSIAVLLKSHESCKIHGGLRFLMIDVQPTTDVAEMRFRLPLGLIVDTWCCSYFLAPDQRRIPGPASSLQPCTFCAFWCLGTLQESHPVSVVLFVLSSIEN